MEQGLTLRISRPIQTLEIINQRESETSIRLGDDKPQPETEGVRTEQAGLRANLEQEVREIPQICRTLDGLITKFNQLCDNLFVEHRNEIAKLSVEIARRILVQKVQERDYRIESIVEEAIQKAPSRRDVVVHLNPIDFSELKKLQQEKNSGVLEGLDLVSDPAIGAAECLIESPKGTIESAIKGHLERISKALENTR
jgi:flagellar biosynthesis/type III secretory pathway protein FliH